MTDTGLLLDGLAAGYGGRPVIAPQNLSLASGDFVCLLGRNGAGKSTLLRTLAGLQPALAGCALLNGTAIHTLSAEQRARQIAVVLTERVSAPGLSVRDVLYMGRQPFTAWLGKLDDADRTIAEDALATAGGAHLLERMLDELSDGERQRVMIARALTQQPRLLLLDEITAFLDLPGRVRLMSLLRDLARRTGVVVVLSSHDLDLSLQLADRLWLLPGDGQLLSGAPEQLAFGGHINAAFDADAIRFSTDTGAFEIAASGIRTASVDGEGPSAFWAGRVLQRLGYTVTPSGETRIIAAPTSWTVESEGQTRPAASLDDVITLLST